MSNLKKEELEFLKSLFSISMDIKKCYKRLAKMDFNNEKNLVQYHSNIKELKDLLEIEFSLYAKIVDDTNKLQMLLEYICYKENINNFEEDLKILALKDDAEITKRRVVIKLLNKKMQLESNKLANRGSEVEQLLSLAKNNNPYFNMVDLMKLSDSLKMDFIMILLQTSLNKKEHEEFQVPLHYNLAFLYDNIEQNFISKKGFREEPVYLASKTYAEYKGIDKTTFKHAQEIFGYQIACAICENYQNDNIELLDILNVSLTFCDESEVAKLKDAYGDIIKLNNPKM